MSAERPSSRALTLPTELWLLILDPLINPQQALSAPQPSDVQHALHAVSLTSRQLHAVASPYLYDCLHIQSTAQLEHLVAHSFPARERRVRTLIYSGALRGLPLQNLDTLLAHVAPTLERLFLNLSLGMPLATYNNPLLSLRPTLQLATNLREFGSFSTASDEIVFPLRRQLRRVLQAPPEMYVWPRLERLALVSLNMGSALLLAQVLPALKSVVLPAQALEENFIFRLHQILASLPLPPSPEERKDLVWVRHKDDMDEGDASGAWFLFHFLPVVELLAERYGERVRVWLVHADVGRGALGRWMMGEMLAGKAWADMGVQLGQEGARAGGKLQERVQ